MRRYEILMEFAGEQKEIPSESLSDVMLLDLYLRENLKSRPSFASDQKPYERLIWITGKRKKSRKPPISRCSGTERSFFLIIQTGIL